MQNRYHLKILTFRHRITKQSHYRTEVYLGDSAYPVATTIVLWSDNAGCGLAAALADGNDLANQLICQNLFA